MRAAGQIQRGKGISGAVKLPEFRCTAEVQGLQFVIGAVENLQLAVVAEVQFGQIVSGAVEPLQLRKIPQTLQRGDSKPGAVDLGNRIQLVLPESSVSFKKIAVFLKIVPERLIREMRRIDRDRFDPDGIEGTIPTRLIVL